MFKINGILRYGPGLTASVVLNRQFAEYYRSLIPKYYNVQGSRYPPHATVVRLRIETPINLDAWSKYEGEKIALAYENIIRNDGVYWWIDVYSDRIGEIRKELGLGTFREGYRRYHCTIGNTKLLGE